MHAVRPFFLAYPTSRTIPASSPAAITTSAIGARSSSGSVMAAFHSPEWFRRCLRPGAVRPKLYAVKGYGDAIEHDFHVRQCHDVRARPRKRLEGEHLDTDGQGFGGHWGIVAGFPMAGKSNDMPEFCRPTCRSLSVSNIGFKIPISLGVAVMSHRQDTKSTTKICIV